MTKHKFTTAQVAALVAVATLASNVLGFVREMILANFFGAGMVSDAYVMGISIPTTLLAAIFTAMGTAYMPILAEKFENQGIDEANRVTSQLLNLMFIIVAALYLLALIFSKQFVAVFAPGYEGEKQALTIYYMRFAFITLFFTAGTTFCDAYLRYRGTFASQKFIAIVENVFMIIFIWIAAHGDHRLMILGIVIGYGVNFIGQAILTVKKGFVYRPDFHFSGPVKEVLVLALPIFIGGGFSELNTFIDKMLASNLVEGTVTALNYSGKLITLILTFTAGTFSTIIYPKLNRAFAQNDYDRISSLTERGINLLSLLTIPFALGALVYATPVVKLVFERGAFSNAATELVSVAFFFYAFRIPFYGVNELLNRTFYSMHDTKDAVYCSVAAVTVNIVLNIILSRIMGIAGLALATSIAELVGMFTRWTVFTKKYKDITLLKSKRKLLRILIFSVAAVGISFALYLLLGAVGSLILRLGVSVIFAMLVYLAMLKIAKFEELQLLRDLIKK